MQNQSGSPQADTNDGNPPFHEVPEKKTGFIRKYPVISSILLGVIAVTVVYFWKDAQGKKQVAVIEKMATEQMMQNNKDMLRLMAKPLVWGIRTELLRSNLEQVDLFTSDLVKQKNFLFIHLIDPTGKIINSTDKKLEEQSAIGLFDGAILQTDSIMIVKDENEILTLAAPVMGYDKKIALLVLKYKTEKFNPVDSQATKK